MNYSKWILGAALLFSAQIASVQGGHYDRGYGNCDPCDPCYSNPCDLCNFDWCDAEFDFYVDALYWKFCHSGIGAFDNDDDEFHHVHHDWEWGFRIGGAARLGNWDLGFRWTSFDWENGHEGLHHEFDYDVLDIEVGYTCCVCEGLTIRPIAGAKLAWIDDKFDADDDDFAFEGEFHNDTDAYGLYLGASGRWQLCNYDLCDRSIPIAFVTRATTGVLYSDADHHIEIDGEDFDTNGSCHYVAVHDLYAGLELTFCDLCGWDAFFQVGYEVQWWGGWKSWSFDDDSGDLHDHLANWGAGGLVLRFGASF